MNKDKNQDQDSQRPKTKDQRPKTREEIKTTRKIAKVYNLAKAG